MKPGSLVECVKGASISVFRDCLGNTYDFPQPVIGDIYTVREIINTKDHGTGITLEEISNPVIKWDHDMIHEPLYNIIRFREIQPPVEIIIESILSEPIKIIESCTQ